MALSKQSSQRYTSAGAFADDLRPHPGKMPVIAREPAFWYVARRFAQRHPGGVLAGIFIVLTTVTGLLVAAWQARFAMRQWHEAQTLLAEVRQLTPAAVFEKLATIQMVEVWIPMLDGRWLVMPRHTQPDKDVQAVLDHLQINLPSQPPPRIRAPQRPALLQLSPPCGEDLLVSQTEFQ